MNSNVKSVYKGKRTCVYKTHKHHAYECTHMHGFFSTLSMAKRQREMINIRIDT